MRLVGKVVGTLHDSRLGVAHLRRTGQQVVVNARRRPGSVRPLVPLDLQRLAALNGSPTVVCHDGDATVGGHHITHTLHGTRLLVVVRHQFGTHNRRAGDGRKSHARQACVQPVHGGARDDLRRVPVPHARADQAVLCGGLEFGPRQVGRLKRTGCRNEVAVN
ncbi:MAG: hypothetical protein U0X20_10035 [Caldilineaceae bacterium]